VTRPKHFVRVLLQTQAGIVVRLSVRVLWRQSELEKLILMNYFNATKAVLKDCFTTARVCGCVQVIESDVYPYHALLLLLLLLLLHCQYHTC
jgi:hypothetical protein